MLNQVLQENGFTGKEAKIYLATLELGSAPASSIARHAEENRITTYTVLKELCKKSIATEVIRGKIKYYTVISPKRLLKLQEEKSKKLEKMIPTLLAIADKHGNAPKIYFYEGLEGLKKGYEDVLTSKGSIYAFLGVQSIEPRLKKYLDTEYIPKRIKSKVFAKVILPYSKANVLYAQQDKVAHRKTLLVKDAIFNMESEINLYGKDKIFIAMFTKKEMSGIIIESKNLYTSLKTIFQLLRSTYETRAT